MFPGHPVAGRLAVHVNLSVKQMNEDGLVQLVADVLAETKLAARKLVLEVTESIFILHYERHVKILNTLRARASAWPWTTSAAAIPA